MRRRQLPILAASFSSSSFFPAPPAFSRLPRAEAAEPRALPARPPARGPRPPPQPAPRAPPPPRPRRADLIQPRSPAPPLAGRHVRGGGASAAPIHKPPPGGGRRRAAAAGTGGGVAGAGVPIRVPWWGWLRSCGLRVLWGWARLYLWLGDFSSPAQFTLLRGSAWAWLGLTQPAVAAAPCRAGTVVLRRLGAGSRRSGQTEKQEEKK